MKLFLKKSFKTVYFVFFLFLLPCFFISCLKNRAGKVEMQQLAPQDLSPRISWALVSDPYVACRKEAGYEYPTVASFRKGDIYEIKGNCTLLVDEVKEVITLGESEIDRSPQNSKNRDNSYINGIGKSGDDLISIFEIDAIVDSVAVS